MSQPDWRAKAIANYTPPPRTYQMPALPEEPPRGTVLHDREGDSWFRRPDGRWYMDGGAWGNRWRDVLEHGPLTEVPQ